MTESGSEGDNRRELERARDSGINRQVGSC